MLVRLERPEVAVFVLLKLNLLPVMVCVEIVGLVGSDIVVVAVELFFILLRYTRFFTRFTNTPFWWCVSVVRYTVCVSTTGIGRL